MGKYNYNRIKELLAKHGKSNIELAKYMGVTVKTASNWCTNSSQPEVEKLFRIGEFLGVEARELLTERRDLKEIKGKK